MRQWTPFLFGFLIFGICMPLCALGDSNNITSLVFTTNPQSVTANAASQAITVQTENSGGTAEKVSETNDVTFTSSSATGQFLNSSGSAVSTTMSTNTASRTFYYEDSTPGTYVLTVNIKGRTSGKQFAATQTVTVGAGGSSTSNTDNSAASSTDSSSINSSTTSSDDSDSSQAYSSESSIYEGPDNESFNLTIGRNRLASVGEPVAFTVRLIPESVSFGGILFHWAFGDGTDWDGTSATHTYAYPGDYIVVVSANRYGDEAVAEAKVKVVATDISIVNSSNGAVVVANNSDNETNLGGWILADTVGKLVVPQDTIVAAHSSITIPASVMKTKQFVGAVNIYNSPEAEIAAAPAAGAASGAVSIALPHGMTVDNLKDKLAAALHATSTEKIAVAQSVIPAIAEVRVATTSQLQTVAMHEASSSAATVIYAIPRGTGHSMFASVASWFEGLFGKQ